jgi:hypothetical protein
MRDEEKEIRATLPVAVKETAGRDGYPLLVADILSIVDDEDMEPIEAVSTLRQRIGGWANVKSYVACLLVGAKKSA